MYVKRTPLLWNSPEISNVDGARGKTAEFPLSCAQSGKAFCANQWYRWKAFWGLKSTDRLAYGTDIGRVRERHSAATTRYLTPRRQKQSRLAGWRVSKNFLICENLISRCLAPLSQKTASPLLSPVRSFQCPSIVFYNDSARHSYSFSRKFPIQSVICLSDNTYFKPEYYLLFFFIH